MKSYTDLEQSKVLSKILPLESADMYYDDIVDRVTGELFIPNDGSTIKVGKGLCGTINAWSLASLLGVLPRRIELEGVAYELCIYLNGLYYWKVNNGNLLLKVKGKDNLVDACYEMILKLKELNLFYCDYEKRK